MARQLGTFDAVVLGLGSMIGAGVFAAIGPAAAAAGSGLLVGLGLAAVVAYCNATSSAQLAALHPSSGGTYLYGRERLGAFWGYLAGWGFVVGKTAQLTSVIVAVVLAALVAVVVASAFGGQAHADHLGPVAAGGVGGVLQSAGLLLFAFAGWSSRHLSTKQRWRRRSCAIPAAPDVSFRVPCGRMGIAPGLLAPNRRDASRPAE